MSAVAPDIAMPIKAAARYNMYATIHKGLRACMCNAVVSLGHLDPDDPADVERVSHAVREMLDFCLVHVELENRFQHVAMEKAVPGSASRAGQDHAGHVERIAALKAQVESMASDHAAARRLYRELASFVAHNFDHMEFEETEHTAVLWQSYTDAELVSIEERVLEYTDAHLSPAQLRTIFHWTILNTNQAERIDFVVRRRRTSPPERFAKAVAFMRSILPESDWRKLCDATALDGLRG
jgi:hypothetical protein